MKTAEQLIKQLMEDVEHLKTEVETLKRQMLFTKKSYPRPGDIVTIAGTQVLIGHDPYPAEETGTVNLGYIADQHFTEWGQPIDEEEK